MYYQPKYGQRGIGGALEIQGIVYTASGSHTVTDANRPVVPVEYNMISGGSGGQGQGYHTGDIGEGPGADPFVGHFGDLGADGTSTSIINLTTSAVIDDTGSSATGVGSISEGNIVYFNGDTAGYGRGGRSRQFGVQRYSSESQLTYSAKAGVEKSGKINLPVGTQIQVIVGTGGRGGNANNTGVNIPLDFGNPGGEGEGPQTRVVRIIHFIMLVVLFRHRPIRRPNRPTLAELVRSTKFGMIHRLLAWAEEKMGPLVP
jgi:hypothetical protein